jgi:hypothetical protein
LPTNDACAFLCFHHMRNWTKHTCLNVVIDAAYGVPPDVWALHTFIPCFLLLIIYPSGVS